ncbi:MAG: NRDE family protein [Pseudomonadota bacterium]
MCLIAFAWEASAEYPFALVANRDEFHARPTQALGWWPNTQMVAGRDLQAGGTWLGLTQGGRFAAVTNVREGNVEQPARQSRGALVTHVLASQAPLDTLQTELLQMGQHTAGFNLLFGDLFGADHELRYLSNRPSVGNLPGVGETIDAGVYALSNAGLHDDWPKTREAEIALKRALRLRHPDGFWDVTADRRVAEPDDLPDTGVGADIERFLSAAFIVGDNYGTRSTIRLLGQPKSSISISERRFNPNGELTGCSQVRVTRNGPDSE